MRNHDKGTFIKIEFAFLGIHLLLIIFSYFSNEFVMGFMVVEFAWGCVLILASKYFTEKPERKNVTVTIIGKNPINQNSNGKVIPINKNLKKNKLQNDN